jgi:S1-C subfamily serine protease
VRSLLLVGIGLVIGAAIALPAWTHFSRSNGQPIASVTPEPAAEEAERDVVPIEPLPPPPDPPRAPEKPEPDISPPPSAPALEDVIAAVLPGVASIQAGPSRGTGFFVQFDTLITNAHVVEGQTTVRLQVGQSVYAARVMSVSRTSDLAVLQVSNPDRSQRTLALGSAARARVGQEVYAVGSALGVLSNTVTRGIVSALRQVGPVRLVQTDAAINPGNSGGPLVDREGTVIGVNSMTVARQVGEGVAFAVAIEHAVQLLAGGRAADDAQTPLGGLQQMFTKPAEPDDTRVRAERALDAALQRIAQRADEVDDYWKRYERWCVVSAADIGGRAWFGIYQTGGVRINPTSPYDCAGFLDNVRTSGMAVQTAVAQVTEAARRDGVYPGVVRELRTRHRLNWDRSE